MLLEEWPIDFVTILFTVIAPGFHTLYLETMVKVFTDCSERTILKLENLLEKKSLSGQETIELDLEAEFSNLALDIIGLGVFNYDFGSVTKESPVIQVRVDKIHILTFVTELCDCVCNSVHKNVFLLLLLLNLCYLKVMYYTYIAWAQKKSVFIT